MLPFVSLDADIDLPIDGIDFLNFFLSSAADLTVGGNGRLKGHIAYEKGTFVPGADITIEAEDLRVDLPPYSVSGVGTVQATVGEATSDTLDAHFNFSTISAAIEPNGAAMFTGENIAIEVEEIDRYPSRTEPGKGATQRQYQPAERRRCRTSAPINATSPTSGTRSWSRARARSMAAAAMSTGGARRSISPFTPTMRR